jgi:hypothetical protein
MELDVKWIMTKVSKEIQFSLFPFEYKRLKILHNYFYNDFVGLLTDDSSIINEINARRGDFVEFVKLFLLFDKKREIFDKFFLDIFIDYRFVGKPEYSKYVLKVLNYCNFDWIISFIENDRLVSMLKDFLEQNVQLTGAIMFYIRVVTERPFLITLILTKEVFQKIVVRNDRYSKELVRILGKSKLREYINHRNIHMIETSVLKVVFKDEYIDFTFE